MSVVFEMDGRQVSAAEGETIWQHRAQASVNCYAVLHANPFLSFTRAILANGLEWMFLEVKRGMENGQYLLSHTERIVAGTWKEERTLRKKGTKEAGYDEEGDSDQEEVVKVFHPDMASVEAIVNGLVWWREGVLSNITATLERRLGERVPVNKNEENHPKEKRDPEDRDDGGESGKSSEGGGRENTNPVPSVVFTSLKVLTQGTLRFHANPPLGGKVERYFGMVW